VGVFSGIADGQYSCLLSFSAFAPLLYSYGFLPFFSVMWIWFFLFLFFFFKKALQEGENCSVNFKRKNWMATSDVTLKAL